MKKERKTGFCRMRSGIFLLMFIMFAFCFASVPVNAAGSDGDFTIKLEKNGGKTYIVVDEASLEALAETNESIMEAYLCGEITITVRDANNIMIDTSKNIDDMDDNYFQADFTVSSITYTSNYLIWEKSSISAIPVVYCKDKTMDYTVSSDSEKITSSITGYFAKMTFSFAKAGELTLSNTGNWNMYTSMDNGGSWDSYGYGSSMKIQAGTTLQILVKGNKGAVGKLTYSYKSLGDSLEGWNSKNTAKDISRGYDGTTITFEETHGAVWYKFTISKESVVTIYIKDCLLTTYVDLYDANMNTQLASEKKSYQRAENSAIPFYLLDRLNSNGKEDDIVTKALYKPGTYYLYVKDNGGYDGKLKFTRRDYIPISGVTFEKGNNVVLSSYSGVEYYSNNPTKVYPANTDGKITSVQYDTSYFTKESGNMARSKKYGVSTVKYCDERGVVVAQAKVSVVPISFTRASFVGSTNEILIYPDSFHTTLTCKADYIRIYQKKGSKWVCIATVSKNKILKAPYKVKKLKPQTNYQFRLAYYDSASKTESIMTKTFTAGTAIKGSTGISNISKVKHGKYKDAIVHNPGRWNERREPYWVYTAKATVSLKPVKGCKEYELYGCKIYFSSTKNKFLKKTKNSNVLFASARGSKSKLPKTLKFKVRTVRRINSYAVAYGNWSKTKTVKIR